MYFSISDFGVKTFEYFLGHILTPFFIDYDSSELLYFLINGEKILMSHYEYYAVFMGFLIITSSTFFLIGKLFSSKNNGENKYFHEKHKKYYLYYAKYVPYFGLVGNMILAMKYNIGFGEFFFKNILGIIFGFFVNILIVICYAFIMNSVFDWNGFENNTDALIILNILSLIVFGIFSYFYWKKKS